MGSPEISYQPGEAETTLSSGKDLLHGAELNQPDGSGLDPRLASSLASQYNTTKGHVHSAGDTMGAGADQARKVGDTDEQDAKRAGAIGGVKPAPADAAATAAKSAALRLDPSELSSLTSAASGVGGAGGAGSGGPSPAAQPTANVAAAHHSDFDLDTQFNKTSAAGAAHELAGSARSWKEPCTWCCNVQPIDAQPVNI